MSILSNIFKRRQRSAEDWMAVLERHLQIGAGYLEQAFNVQQTVAHIAVDLQKGYCEPCLPLYRLTEDQKQYHYRTAKTLNRISEFSSDLDRAQVSQYWLRHTALFSAKELGKGIEGYRPAMHDEKLSGFIATAQELCLPVDPDRVIDKRFYSGFSNTNLEDQLHAKKIRTVLLTGGMRRACVHETALDAANRNFMTFIVDDLTIADLSQLTPEARATDAFGLADYNIYPVTSEQVRRIIGPAP